jgi:hypothetical protein
VVPVGIRGSGNIALIIEGYLLSLHLCMRTWLATVSWPLDRLSKALTAKSHCIGTITPTRLGRNICNSRG